MEVKEARKRLADLERTITRAVQSFEQDTEVSVQYLKVHTMRNYDGICVTTFVEAETEILADRTQ